MTVLCATDFSPSSRTAIRLAASLARRRGKTLRLLHAVEPLGVDPAVAMVANAAWEAEMVNTAQQQLDMIAGEIRSNGLSVETFVAEGHAAGVILEAARAQETSLIVVGSHGRKGVARLALGSCAAKVACSAPCPVLVSRETGVDFARWESPEPLRLALATDGSVATGAVFFWARTAAPTSPEAVTLVRVYWPPQEGARYGIDDPWLGNEGQPKLLALIERDLRHASEALAGAHVPPVRLQVALRNGGEELAESAPGLGVDALVIGVPKHRLGHWTPIAPKAVLRAARLPVFCIPEGVQPAARRIPRFRSVLIAADLSDVSRGAILPAYGLLAGGGQAHLCYVRTREPPTARPMPAAPSLSGRERMEIEQRLRSLAPAEAAEHGIGTHVSVLEGESVVGAILQAAERLDVDAIALASHGRSGLGRLLVGSVAEEVARKSSRPVLIVHAAD
ncbi:MAG TPA: universal stress protein [Polyangia bacterium]|nr:universal stress protein [Polyangia bacterium]